LGADCQQENQVWDANVHLAEVRLGFTSGEATYRDTRCVALDHFAAALPAHVEIETTLNDAEKVLPIRILVSGDASVEPSYATFHGLLHPSMIWRGSLDDVVQLHDNVRADGVLKVN
jgi:hypothetical protein